MNLFNNIDFYQLLIKKNTTIFSAIKKKFPNKIFFCYVINNNFFFKNKSFDKDCNIFLIFKNELVKYRKILNQTAAIIYFFHLKKKFKNIKLSQIKSDENLFWIEFNANNMNIGINDLHNITINNLTNNNFVVAKSSENKFLSNKYLVKTKNSEYYKYDDFYFISNQIFFKELTLAKHIFINEISGIYFLNNKKNKVLKKIFGFSGFSENDLLEVIKNFKNWKIYDHRIINNNLNFFSINKKIGSGLPIWKENGYISYRLIRNFMENFMEDNKYICVKTPILGPIELYQKSGHLLHYKNNMFPAIKLGHSNMIIRPMTCPHHCILFSEGIKSYRDNPVKFFENSQLFRNESSGSLSGLERVRSMCLVDAHIFTTNNKLKAEIIKCIKQIIFILKLFNIKIVEFWLSLPDFINNSNKYYDDNEKWKKSILILKEGLKELSINYIEKIGEAAFYGPKLDIQILTSMKKIITLSTVQVDLTTGSKFKLKFIDKNNKIITPIIIHLGIIGTYERFISILLEQNNGLLPFWIAPIQVIIIPINYQNNITYCKKIFSILKKHGIRCQLNLDKKRLSQKILVANKKRINYKITIGSNEEKKGMVAISKCNSTNTRFYDEKEMIKLFKSAIDKKGIYYNN